jgi:hypothetical protein
LQAVNGGQQPAHVVEVGGVFAGGNVAGQAGAELGQAIEVVAGDGFFEPDDAEVIQHAADAAALAEGVAAVGVHHELHVWAGELAEAADTVEVTLALLRCWIG